LDRVEAGTASVRLLNQDSAFNPTNTASPYYPDIRPMVPLRIRATWEGPPAPLTISGLVAWYDFTDVATLWQNTGLTTPITADGQTIKGVSDKSPNANHLTEATNGPTYKTAIINGKSIARFDGTNDVLAKDPLSTSLTQPYTVFLVGKAVNSASALLNDPWMDGKTGSRGHAVMTNSGNNGKWGSFYGGSVSDSTVNDDDSTHVFQATASGATSVLRIDGGADTVSGDPGTNTLTCLTVASNVNAGGSAFAEIDLAHLALYTGDLTNTDKDALGEYFAAAMGTTWTPVS
jgi:hypothetical protein